MKKIKENEEFQMGNRVFTYNMDGGKINLVPGKKLSPKKAFIPPTEQDVKDFFKKNSYNEESAIKFYQYYSSADWKDGKGNEVKNWKQKSIGVWFKAENKIITPSFINNTEQKIKFFQ